LRGRPDGRHDLARSMKIRKAVIPAAGFGTRFLPVTKVVSKQLLPIIDTPTIQYIVEEIVAAGIETVVLVAGRDRGAIQDYFDRAPELEAFLDGKKKPELSEQVRELARRAEIVAVRQQEALGLGHAVLCARHIVGDEPFAVLLGDEIYAGDAPCIGQLAEVATAQDAPVIALMRVTQEQTKAYGVVAARSVGERLHQVTDMVEKPGPAAAPSNLAIMGRYILPPEIFPILAETKPGAGGEIQLTDGMRTLAGRRAFYGYEFRGERYDAGDRLGFVQATVAFALKRPDLADGVRAYLKSLKL
jgi:UTP--glucose-1-phosphate uridylyltransferase